MKNVIDYVLIVLWVCVGIMVIFEPVTKVSFYCLLVCYLMEKVQRIIEGKL